MSLSALAFYAVNVLVVFGYIVAVALMTRGRGLTGRGRLPLPLLLPALVFFSCCIGIHTELAWHAFTGDALVDDTGHVKWHFLTIVAVKAGATYAFLLASLIAARGEVPLSPNINVGDDAHHRHADERRGTVPPGDPGDRRVE